VAWGFRLDRCDRQPASRGSAEHISVRQAVTIAAALERKCLPIMFAGIWPALSWSSW
jgi:hypothetical protein